MSRPYIRGNQNSRSFFSTLLISFILISAASTLLLTIFLTINYFHSMKNSLEESNQQLLAQTNYAIDQIDENVERLASSLMNSNNINAYLAIPDIENTVPVLTGRELTNQMMTLPYVESIYLYNSSTGCAFSTRAGYQQPLSGFEDSEAADRLMDEEFLRSHSKRPVPSNRDPITNDAKILSYYFPTFYGDRLDHAIVINVHTSSLTDSIASMKQLTTDMESNFIILDENQKYLTGVLENSIPDKEAWKASTREVLLSRGVLDTAFVKIDDTSYFQVHTADNTYGWNLLNYIPAQEIFSHVISTTLIGLLLFTCVLCVTFFFCLHFSRRLNTPVETLARFLNEKKLPPRSQDPAAPREFQKILSAVSLLQENNQQLRSLQQKTRYSQTQDYLNSLLLGRDTDAPALAQEKMEHFGLAYLTREKLCMAVIKIDQYQQYLRSHNADELWATRFSVINIVEELVSARLSCNAFSHADDKFVLLMAIPQELDEALLEQELEALFSSIQENLDTYLHFTVSIAYSTFFHGIDSLPVVYANMEKSLLLKIRYGHNCIIDPYQLDDLPDEAFHLSYRGILQLLDRLINGQSENAWSDYQALTEHLFEYDYSEILSTTIHITYSIYERLIEKYPMLKEPLTREIKDFLPNLQAAEVSDDIYVLVRELLETICAMVRKLKQDPSQQNSPVIVEKVMQIIQEKYPDPTLCLNSIADMIGLSANYTGHIFKQHTQKSVAQHILDVRMEEVARYLKTTSLPLDKILEKAGLEKNNYFYTRFKNYFGMSLSEYKQKHQ